MAAFVMLLLSGIVEIQSSFEDNNPNPTNLTQLTINITEISAPEKTRLSPFLFYDERRNVVWVGDITTGSDKILEFELNSSKFVTHDLSGVNFVTHITMDSKSHLWYTDPGMNSLGEFNPDDGSNRIYPIPVNETSSGIVLDNLDNVWIVIPDESEILEFDVQKEKFNTVNLPPASSFPLAITSDQSGQIWIAESLGKIVHIDPANYNITEFGQSHLTFSIPTSIVSDPTTGKIYFSEHNAYVVSQFDPTSKLFKRYSINFGGFPAGLTFDNFGNLWVSQHTLDKIAVIDTVTGQIKQFDLPSGSLVQWLTRDPNGDIMFVDQRSNTLGIIKIFPAAVPEFPLLSMLVFTVSVSLVLFLKENRFDEKIYLDGNCPYGGTSNSFKLQRQNNQFKT